MVHSEHEICEGYSENFRELMAQNVRAPDIGRSIHGRALSHQMSVRPLAEG
jgi:hypothetical protein